MNPPSATAFPFRWKTLLILGIVVIALLLAVRLSVVFTPLLIAFLLTYIWNPVVTKLERWMPRLAAIALIYVAFFGVLTLVALFGLPELVRQTTSFVDEGFIGDKFEDRNKNGLRDADEPYEDSNANGRYDAPKFQKFVAWSEERLHEWLGADGWRQAYGKLKERMKGRESDVVAALQEALGALFQGALSSFRGLLTIISYFVFIPIYMFFLLKNMNQWWEKFQRLIPHSYRDQAIRAMTRIHDANAAFFRGQITIAFIEGAIVFVVLTALKVKLALVFGGMYAVLAMIPYVGVISVFTLTSVFVLADTGGVFDGKFYGVVALFLSIQVLETLVLQPLILGKETGLHPMLIIISLFVFADLFGFLGVLLAVPLASTFLILAQEYLMPILREGERSGETAVHKLPIGGPPRT
jgi:predicted PurR-regulated permease PerM